MTVALVALSVACGLLCLTLYLTLRESAKERAATDIRYAAERRELLTRIQHPEVIPMPQRKPAKQREARDTAAMAQVGRIQPPKDPA